MGYAKYVGRVGALAFTLGVGVAMASAPPVAYAETPGSSTDGSSATGGTTAGGEGTTTGSGATPGADTTTGTDLDNPGSGATTGPTVATTPVDEDDEEDESAKKTDEKANNADRKKEDSEAGDEQDSNQTGPDDDGAGTPQPVVDTPPTTETANDGAVPSNDGSGSHEAPSGGGAEAALEGSGQSQPPSTAEPGVADGDEQQHGAAEEREAGEESFTTFAFANASSAPSAFKTAVDTSAVAQPQPTLISVVSNVVTAMLQPLLSLGTAWLPMQSSLLVGALSLVRNEFERAMVRRDTPAQYTITQIGGSQNALLDSTPNVLVIGVDGTNLSRILAGNNPNFDALIGGSTTAASSIVGHTTVSNPSWTAILTGAWGERTGVINNVFTPWTYENFPTVFTQLETLNPDINTMAIADWDVINAIAGTGARWADHNVYIPHVDGDTYWDATDDLVGFATVTAINNALATESNFIFSYFVGVDENGHMFGGDSPEYAAAINNVDDNLGDILSAIEAWEAANGEEWTVIVVTDHGHQPQKGFGHGFQTPDETATFVIARGPIFADGAVNPNYQIVDTTPTVMALFGGTALDPDGVPLMDRGGTTTPPDVQAALEAMIATNHSPDIVTNIRLSLRTIAGFIPYFIWDFTKDSTGVVKLVGDTLYVATNVPAQLIALLTGVNVAPTFHILPPGSPTWPDDPHSTLLLCGDSVGGTAGTCSTVV